MNSGGLPEMKPALLVVGPSRSGSSALTAVMSLCGAALPATLMPPGPGNERGHFEPQLLMELNDEILALHGGTYWDPLPVPPGWFESAAAEGFVARIAALITAEYGDPLLPVIKDPRLCRVAPLYVRALERLGRTVLAVVPLRHPAVAARSLLARDGVAGETAELLQVRELLGAERFTRGLRRVLVPYDALMADWRGTMRHVAGGLGFAWPVGEADAAAAVEGFLSPELRHQAVVPVAGGLAARLWAAALDGLGGDEARLRAEFDAVGAIVDEMDRLAGPWLAERAARLVAAEAGLAAARADGDRLRADVAALRAEIDGLHGSRSWRITRPLRVVSGWLGGRR